MFPDRSPRRSASASFRTPKRPCFATTTARSWSSSASTTSSRTSSQRRRKARRRWLTRASATFTSTLARSPEPETMSSPPVPVVSAPEPPQPLTLVCANCHAALAGEYCGVCGQRHEPHVHTVAHFAGEAFESVSHADSRLWRTLWYLLARPGFLTREFFAGRRVRYLPPFRLYLVLSVLMFLLTSLNSNDPTLA